MRKPKQQRSIETRMKILEAGEKLFSKQGFYKTNSKQIAKEAGVATGTFYMYFKDKKPLFLEIFLSYYQAITEAVLSQPIGDIETANDAKKVIHKLIQQLYQAHTIAPDFHREMIAMIYSDPEVKELNDREEESAIRFLVELLKPFKKKIRPTDLETAARLIQRTVEEVIHSIRIFGAKTDEKRLLNELEDMIFRYLFKE